MAVFTSTGAPPQGTTWILKQPEMRRLVGSIERLDVRFWASPSSADIALRVDWIPKAHAIGCEFGRVDQGRIWVPAVPLRIRKAYVETLLASALPDAVAWVAKASREQEHWRGGRHQILWRTADAGRLIREES